MQKPYIHSIKTKHGFRTTGKMLFPIAKKALWEKAGHPNKLSYECMHLDTFHTPETMKVGNKVEELHNFFGLTQNYEGVVTSYKEGELWGMETFPTNRNIFGLPHKVQYSFSGESNGKLTVACDYTPKGLFSLPIIRSLVVKVMERTINKLILSPLAER